MPTARTVATLVTILAGVMIISADIIVMQYLAVCGPEWWTCAVIDENGANGVSLGAGVLIGISVFFAVVYAVTEIHS